MFGKRRNKLGNGQNRNQSTAGFCVCSACGYSIPHTKGSPCSSFKCPVCNIWLVRSDVAPVLKETSVQQALSQQPVIKTIVFPKVNPELCTGCGTCIDICPKNAIVMQDDKAFILENLCKNCKKCVRVCPSGAIE
jgi:MinD superfamily P-loop ATPase